MFRYPKNKRKASITDRSWVTATDRANIRRPNQTHEKKQIEELSPLPSSR